MLTVIFASHNGERTLPRVFDAYARLDPPTAGWHLIAVDNASTDRTAALLKEESRRGRLPLTTLHEPRPGKNRALNRAIDHFLAEASEPDDSEGALVVLTDDDVLPEPDWLIRLAVAAREHGDFAIFGGAIQPAFPAPPPSWLSGPDAPAGVLYAATSRTTGPCPADLVWGPNMAIRPAVFRRGFRFDTTVGPGVGTQYPMGSETEFTVRLQSHGYRAWFVDDAVVHHVVRPHQMTEAFAAGRAFRHGFGVVRYEPALLESRWPRLFGLPARLLLEIALWQVLGAMARLLPASAVRFRAVYQRAWWRGVLSSIARRRDEATAHSPADSPAVSPTLSRRAPADAGR